jgi:hypothetical protein
MKILFLLLISAAAYSQPNYKPNYNAGIGKSVTSIASTIQAGVGFRIGPVLYVEGQISGYTNGYPAAAFGAVIGAAHSWNNRRMHELTTIFYAKADKVLAANSGYKAEPPLPFGFGVRHYVYEFFVDVGYMHSQAVFTIGYSLNSLYR